MELKCIIFRQISEKKYVKSLLEIAKQKGCIV